MVPDLLPMFRTISNGLKASSANLGFEAPLENQSRILATPRNKLLLKLVRGDLSAADLQN